MGVININKQFDKVLNFIHQKISEDGKITGETLSYNFPILLGNIDVHAVFKDEESCVDFIKRYFQRYENSFPEIFDPVSHPSHYTEGRKYEPRKVIADWGLNFNLGSAVKYISRAGRKGKKVEDLRKAIQSIEFEIEELTKNDRSV